MANNLYLESSQKNYKAHFNRANLFVNQANKTEQYLSNTLFIIATAFLGLSSPLLSDVGILTTETKVLLFLSWIVTISSIAFGLVHIKINLEFFAKSLKASNDREKIWIKFPDTKKSFDRAYKESMELDSNFPEKTSFTMLILQASFMLAAIVIIVIVGGLALFKDENKNNHKLMRNNFKTKYYQQKNYDYPKKVLLIK